MVNTSNSSEFALAVAQLAAAAMASDPTLGMDAAVVAARESLRGASVSSDEIAKSVQPDKIKCLEDGTWHIMLRRYLRRRFNMSPEQYRTKWGLPTDYPMVAPNYSVKRTKIAKKTGLGVKKS
ncbi:MAG: MucR family transcriptional regulator [Alphaproteobacteria bacterium]|nr:MucR family transcriptional regulator [Alphaproteobacteria bacterium]